MMKKSTYALITILIVLMFSCQGKAQDKNNTEEQDTNVNESKTDDAKSQDQNVYDWKANMEQLAKKKPLTDDEFSAWYPKSLFGLPATNIRSTANEEMASFTVTYYANKQRIDLNLMDGAGKKGARLTAPASRIATQEVDEKMGDGYLKTVKKNGITARESYTPANNTYRIKFMANNRFYVDIKTMNLGKDRTWEAVEAFKFNNLNTQ